MKRMLALLLCAAMALSMTACAGGAETTTAAETDTTALQDTTAAPETTAVPLKRENRLVYGTSARLDGNFAAGMFVERIRNVTGVAADVSLSEDSADNVLCGLLTDYSVMAIQRDGTYAYNMTVLAQEPAVADYPDGSRTYTFRIREDLVYNTGKAITAGDYVFTLLFTNSEACAALSGYSYDGKDYPNAAAFCAGQSAVFGDVRLLSQYSWSVTVTAQQAARAYAPTCALMAPFDVEYWLGQGYAIADDGQGCFLKKDGKAVAMDAALAAAVSANFAAAKAGRTLPMVTAGPYQLTAFDETAKTAILEKNPNYVGNFEGQKPTIETLEIRYMDENALVTALEEGDIDLADTLKNGVSLNTLAEQISQGAQMEMDVFDRPGYGKLQFVCDAMPTQFIEVRQAIAYVLDRQALVDLYCQGWGNVVDGPYSGSLWMAEESELLFENALNHYAINVKTAQALLERGGWTLDEYGDAWSGEGVRYREVTAAQAAHMEGCVEIDGRILMPLIVRWAAPEDNLVTRLLNVLLTESEDVATLGMEIHLEEMDAARLMGYLYRQDLYGVGNEDDDFTTPQYAMFNLATGWRSAEYDVERMWSGSQSDLSAGYNTSHLYDPGDGGLDALAQKIAQSTLTDEPDGYLTAWQNYVIRYNQMLPELPLYADQYATVYPVWLVGYDQDSFWGFRNAILYARIEQ